MDGSAEGLGVGIVVGVRDGRTVGIAVGCWVGEKDGPEGAVDGSGLG